MTVRIEDMKEIGLMIIDQGTWRGQEWGDDLVEGQFDHAGVAFTKDNVNEVYDWLQSAEGQEHLTSVMAGNSCYWDYADDIEEALEDWNDEEYGYFGNGTRNDELEKAA